MSPIEPHVVVDAADVAIALDASSAGEATVGDPAAGHVELIDFDEASVGLWEMSAGGARDVEADELFIVVSGHAAVRLLEDYATLELRPGSIVRLRAGTATEWTVYEDLRKLYITGTPTERTAQ